MDHVLHTDFMKSATGGTTGSEDLFGFAHLFYQAMNKSYAFVGGVGCHSHQYYGYRFFLTDPIHFYDNIMFYFETNIRQKRVGAKDMKYREFLDCFAQNCSVLQTNTIFYYKQDQSRLIEADSILFGSKHTLEKYDQYISKNKTIINKRFMGNYYQNMKYNFTCVQWKSKVELKLKIKSGVNNIGGFLRRTSYSPVGLWNSKAKVKVKVKNHHDLDLGIWYIPKGAVQKDVTLIESDFLLPQKVTRHKEYIRVIVEPLTQFWFDTFEGTSLHLH